MSLARHVFVRHSRARRAAVAVAASAALAAGLSPLLPSAAAAEAPQETVVPAALRSTNLVAALQSPDSLTGADGAGTEGVFHRQENSGRYLWARYADGKTFEAPAPASSVAVSGTGSDVLAYRHPGGRIDLWNAADGTTRTFQLPAGQGLLAVYGTTVVTYHSVTDADGTTTRVPHLLIVGEDGSVVDKEVGGLPAGMTLGQPRGADASGVVFNAMLDGTMRVVAVNRTTGRVENWTRPLPSTTHNLVKLSPDHVAVYSRTRGTKVLVLPRSDLSAAPVEVTPTGNSTANYLALAGDWLVQRLSSNNQVTAQPLAGGPAVTLLTSTRLGLSTVSNGTALAVGRTAADDWGIQRIHAGPDGRPVVTQVKALPKPPAPIQGISLEQGRLVVTDTSDSTQRDDYVRTVAATGTPAFGERSEFTPRIVSDVVVGTCPANDVSCSQVFGTADGRIAWLEHTNSDTEDLIRVNGPTEARLWEKAVPAGGRITDVSGRYVLYTDTDKQYVYKIGDYGTPSVTRTPGAAALSGDVLWTAGTTPGSVTAYSLTAKKATETLTTDAGCKPTDLQSLGRYLYWTCDGRAGVYDRTAKKSVPVPTGEAKLGDGYVVTHDKQAGKLTLTTVAGGTPTSRVIGDLPDTPGVSQRDVRWTVDEAGANAAYVDGEERVHLVPSGVAQQPLRLLGPAQSASYVESREGDQTPDTLTTVSLSKPSASWRLTVRDKATGKVVDVRNGGAARGEVSLGWGGRTSTGGLLPSGPYDWTLSVTPADGVGAPVEARGSVRLLHGSPVRHDHTGSQGLPDGTGDLLTLNSSGALTFQQGTGKGTFSGKVSGSGWATSVVAVPFGDLNKDNCNDVLVRMSDGSLRGYKVKCGLAPTPSMSYTKLGTGWKAYNVLTSPGDLTGDKRPDLLARKASTGDIHLFAAKSDGTLAAGKKIRSKWTGYTKIVGAGDLTGDGIGDVLARDKAGTLYRYNGTGTGLLKERVKVFANWGASYNAIVGVGDITGDGKNDLVVRDTAGNLYRQSGNGKGSFAARVKIASGWQGYRGIF
ncbi:FG-GAP-like repeat-containing protein [Streptomyces sp. NL15-2K]|uniref:FG-GAP-like repeat-containing protein n=1 Tax=Streptomyces sp. NL15-2K TaxID=376149 RepID=UPI001C0F13B2|nr:MULTISPECIES: FG-GAP-like repeat-containing protein [Actinomycetes]WKX10545.1 hypothetical protein Q4V64_24765 [Kutzneria buriramensis]